MRKITGVVLLTLFLGGCITDNLQDKLSSAEQKVVEATKVICGFVPLVSTVGPLLDIFSGGSASAVTLAANAICQTVTKKGRRLGDGGWLVTVNKHGVRYHVPIQGHFEWMK